MKIKFSPPFIDKDIEENVLDSLRSGWITTGPKAIELEKLVAKISGVEFAIGINSWSSGAALCFKWLGIGKGDEVIVPAYTYFATAATVLHTGATPVMVDILDDFTIDPEKIRLAISPRTKAILAVDFAGLPCHYKEIRTVIENTNQEFAAKNEVQKKLGRPLLIADAAHSIGAKYANKPSALAADISIYSLSAVKNITTAEGGMICLNLPEEFVNKKVFDWMKTIATNGQTKNAYSKSVEKNWQYDIHQLGMKINLTDICAAIGLSQLKKYEHYLLPERKRVSQHYFDFFSNKKWAILPIIKDEMRVSVHHLFPLRIRNFSEGQRNKLIAKLKKAGIETNVHFIPMSMLSLFKDLGYKIEDYPIAYKNYSKEISLPIYPQLTDEECCYIEQHLEKAYNEIIND